mmetsp:Transcript_24194/g.48405  ORF Transcript_24194/g.48405 Transcript_24194/m.48405 type:complete len:240 (-) Transcript_24194:911-1630(-)
MKRPPLAARPAPRPWARPAIRVHPFRSEGPACNLASTHPRPPPTLRPPPPPPPPPSWSPSGRANLACEIDETPCAHQQRGRQTSISLWHTRFDSADPSRQTIACTSCSGWPVRRCSPHCATAERRPLRSRSLPSVVPQWTREAGRMVTGCAMCTRKCPVSRASRGLRWSLVYHGRSWMLATRARPSTTSLATRSQSPPSSHALTSSPFASTRPPCTLASTVLSAPAARRRGHIHMRRSW